MKKQSWIFIKLLCVYMTSTNVYAQECGPISSRVDSIEAINRIKSFAPKARYFRRQEISSKEIVFDVAQLKSMLTNFRNMQHTKNYDGLRICFAIVPKNNIDSARLSIVIIPTIKGNTTDNCGDVISENDSANAFYFDGYNLQNFDLTNDLNPWTNRALRGLTAYMYRYTDLPAEIGQAFLESKSLWYSKETFFINGGTPDLLTYLESCTSVISVKLYFASFLKTINNISCRKYWFKLHPIFKLEGANIKPSNKFFTLGGQEIKKYLKRMGYNKLLSNKAYTDTGLPCPPNKCK